MATSNSYVAALKIQGLIAKVADFVSAILRDSDFPSFSQGHLGQFIAFYLHLFIKRTDRACKWEMGV
jgi:hypothetical protein